MANRFQGAGFENVILSPRENLMEQEEMQRQAFVGELGMERDLESQIRQRLSREVAAQEPVLTELESLSLQEEQRKREREGDVLAGRLAGRGILRSSVGAETFAEQELAGLERRGEILAAIEEERRAGQRMEEEPLREIARRRETQREEEAITQFFTTQQAAFKEDLQNRQFEIDTELNQLGLREAEKAQINNIFQGLFTGLGSILGAASLSSERKAQEKKSTELLTTLFPKTGGA